MSQIRMLLATQIKGHWILNWFILCWLLKMRLIWLDTYHIVVKINGICRLVEIVHAAQWDPVFDLDRSLLVHVIALLVQVKRDLFLCILCVSLFFLLLFVHRAFLRVMEWGLVLLSQVVVCVRTAFHWVRSIVALKFVTVFGVACLLQENVCVLVGPLGSLGHFHVILRTSREIRVVRLIILQKFDVLDVICCSGSWTFELADFRGERLSLLIIACLLLLHLLDVICEAGGVPFIYILRWLRVLR